MAPTSAAPVGGPSVSAPGGSVVGFSAALGARVAAAAAVEAVRPTVGKARAGRVLVKTVGVAVAGDGGAVVAAAASSKAGVVVGATVGATVGAGAVVAVAFDATSSVVGATTGGLEGADDGAAGVSVGVTCSGEAVADAVVDDEARLTAIFSTVSLAGSV